MMSKGNPIKKKRGKSHMSLVHSWTFTTYQTIITFIIHGGSSNSWPSPLLTMHQLLMGMVSNTTIYLP
jgi:hypothetical protein